MASILDRTREILEQPLGMVVVPADQAMSTDLAALDRWSVPSSDRKALAQWGLPILEQYELVANIQEEATPVENESGWKYYSLGAWINFEITAASPSGEVWGVPLTNWDRTDYFINSSIANFIEMAWRWYQISTVVNSEDSVDCYACLHHLFDFIVARDPRVASSDNSLWREILLSD